MLAPIPIKLIFNFLIASKSHLLLLSNFSVLLIGVDDRRGHKKGAWKRLNERETLKE